jgi:hypothetical protein
MTLKKALGFTACFLAVSMIVLPIYAQSERGKAELSASGGKIAVDYGRPQLKGRDPLTWQKDGSYWRMGSNDMTTFSTPVDLQFGSVKVTKGTYGLWLLKVSAERYELAFNSETSGMGMNHDKSKDVASVPMKKESADKVVETFTIDLKGAGNGGTFVMTWGTIKLSADFQFGK